VIGEPVLLAGHSTGGLVCSLYAHEGPHREQVRALWLNSPFFDWNLPDWRRAQLHMAAALGRFFPFLNDPKALLPDYTQALLDQGWEFDTTLKPVPGFPVYYGWLGAIADAQAKVHAGLDRALPGARHAFRRGRHRARLAAHRALVALARPRRQRAVVPRRDARRDVVAARDPRRGLQAALLLGGTRRDVAGLVSCANVRWRTEACAPGADNVRSTEEGHVDETGYRKRSSSGAAGAWLPAQRAR
jgi:alpha-beta hydrolase superfamily lysophospholipase